MDNINQATSSSKTSTLLTMKGIAKALDTVFKNLNETNSKLNHINKAFEQYQETLQDMYNNLNTTFQDIFSTLSINILEIQDKVIEYTDDQKNILNILEDIRTENSYKPLSEIINPKNKSVKNST
ncbi:36947_t:CDS:2 [Gigaspora margarita]|uniref:36947_t:CDS:1 n=1 Tax=Gigaspora margarita TaxID=4874 RepID=A0ABN7W1U6_GIGMA|nr:36947_t:CDS:2 [Gigaspora margarita]